MSRQYKKRTATKTSVQYTQPSTISNPSVEHNHYPKTDGVTISIQDYIDLRINACFNDKLDIKINERLSNYKLKSHGTFEYIKENKLAMFALLAAFLSDDMKNKIPEVMKDIFSLVVNHITNQP